jgi:plastocyanin
MRSSPRLVAALALGAACVAGGCGKAEQIIGLAHVINDDGSDKGNPQGSNPGTQTLNIQALFIPAGVVAGQAPVGQVGQLFVGYAGQSVSTGSVAWTSSDSSVANFVPEGPFLQVTTLSVGPAKITGTFQGATASVSISVVPNTAGVSAVMTPNSDLGQWSPSTVTIQAGSNVQFNVGQTHNVVFAPMSGVPSNIASGASSDNVRSFQVAGTFAFECTIHGEAGAVIVRP